MYEFASYSAANFLPWYSKYESISNWRVVAAPPAAELPLQRFVREIRHVAEHARDLQAAQRFGLVVVVAAVEALIALDDLAAEDVPGDARHRHGRRRWPWR